MFTDYLHATGQVHLLPSDVAPDVESVYSAVSAQHGHDIAADVAVSVLSGASPADALRDALRNHQSAQRGERRRPMGSADELVRDGAPTPFDIPSGDPLSACVVDRIPTHARITAQHLADGLSGEESARRQGLTPQAIRAHRSAIRGVLVRSILDGLIGLDR